MTFFPFQKKNFRNSNSDFKPNLLMKQEEGSIIHSKNSHSKYISKYSNLKLTNFRSPIVKISIYKCITLVQSSSEASH